MTKNQKGFSLVEGMIILVILGVVSFAGWWAWHNKTAKSQDTSTKTSQKNIDPYAGWKTYNSSVFAAGFKYPTEWSVREVLPCKVNLASAIGQECAVNLVWAQSKDTYPPTIAVERLIKGLGDVESYFDGYYAQSANTKVSKENIQIKGKVAIKYVATISGDITKLMLIQSGDKVFAFYSLNESAPAPGLNYMDVFDKVFATFETMN